MLLSLFVFSATAESYLVPDVDDVKNEPIPLLSENNPLDKRDKISLKKAQKWLDEENYPYDDKQKLIYLFGAGQATLICSPLELCIIYLQKGETIATNGLHLGDSVRWQLSPAIGGNQTQLVIKPIDAGLSTSLVAITNKRTYHIKLISRKDEYMPGIAFKYPDEIQQQWLSHQTQVHKKEVHHQMSNGVNLEDLDFNYQVSNCRKCKFKPLRIYNNGHQTVIEMSKSLVRTDAPALLVTSEQGDELVNYRMKDDKYIVDRLFEEAILIKGVGRRQQKITIKYNGDK